MPAAIAQSSVLTQDYDMSRSGANLREDILTHANVSSASPAAAVLPLSDNYTVLVQANSAGGISYAAIRLLMRSAMFTSVTKIGCKSSNQMDVSLSWQINGSAAPSLWIQDTTTPSFRA
jgi:hypothetical protein